MRNYEIELNVSWSKPPPSGFSRARFEENLCDWGIGDIYRMTWTGNCCYIKGEMDLSGGEEPEQAHERLVKLLPEELSLTIQWLDADWAWEHAERTEKGVVGCTNQPA